MEKYKQIPKEFHPYERVMPEGLENPRIEGICGVAGRKRLRIGEELEDAPWNTLNGKYEW